jgi:hypothetical protein
MTVLPILAIVAVDVDGVELLGLALRLPHLGVDINVILTPPCILCIENHE